MSKLLVLLLVVTTFILLFMATAAADGPASSSFSGAVKLDGAQVADGTLITAVIDGEEYHTHTSTGYGYSTYSITIRPPEGKSYPDGTKVTFKVNGHNSGQIASFKTGANVRLDLTASTTSTLSSSSIVLIACLLLALLGAGAAAYYFRVRRHGLRIADWLGRKANVPSADAHPLAVYSECQTLSRYVWDSAKLAWVENTKPVRARSQMRQPMMNSAKANVPVAAGAGVARQKGQDRFFTANTQNLVVTQKKAAHIPGKEAASNDEILTLCHGNVKLRVNSPSGMGQLRRFSNHVVHLKRTHRITVSKIDFPSSQSISFELFLPSPMPLPKILKGLPEVDTVSDGLRRSLESYHVTQSRDRANTRLVEVKLKA